MSDFETYRDPFKAPLDAAHHDLPTRHRFGDAFLFPDSPSNSFPGDTASPGFAEGPARADHRHGREEAGPDDPAPVGIVSMFAGAIPPTGWLECDGSAISRSTYADLFTRIGTAYGSGDGATTFNLPDLRLKFPRGRHAISSPNGTTGGADQYTHDHTVDPHTHTQNSHNHSGATGTPSATTEVQSGIGSTVASESHTHSISGNTPTINNETVNVQSATVSALPSYQAIMFIIKATV